MKSLQTEHELQQDVVIRMAFNGGIINLKKRSNGPEPSRKPIHQSYGTDPIKLLMVKMQKESCCW